MAQTLEVPCARCNKPTTRKASEIAQRQRKGWAIYCSTTCRDEAKRGRRGVPRSQYVELTCAECGNPFAVQPHRAKRAQYCSLSCSSAAKGRLGGARTHGRVGAERRLLSDGYVTVYVPQDERPPNALRKARHLEHRYVMSQLLGRWPDRHETVHHLNGDRTDNKPENLQLRSGNHGNGRLLRCRCCGSSDIEAIEL
jgi:hypothetical protein